MPNNSVLPYSQASENNKLPILSILQRYFDSVSSVLEIGSGTAQHGEFFAEHFPHTIWQCSDIPENLEITQQRIVAKALQNLPTAFRLNVDEEQWNCATYDCVFTANSLHIMAYGSVVNFFKGLPQCLKPNALLLLYGPFKYAGEFTTESNAKFDISLKLQNPICGIRDFERVLELTEGAGLSFLEDNPMPANNQLLVFRQS